MARQIFVNLPVRDLPRAIAFFTALGFNFNPAFTDDNAACLVIEDNIFAMLLVEPFFRTFTHRQICDTERQIEVLNCLSCDSREEVDALVAKALAAGGAASRPAEDHGFMYAHGFEDPDGHRWELAYMREMPPQAG